MRPLYKTMMMATAVMTLSTAAYADGYKSDQRANNNAQMNNERVTDSQSYSNDMQMNNQRSDMNAQRTGMNNDQMPAQQLSNADIKDVQQSLNHEGHDISVDGIWGRETAEAVRSFQQANNLNATGSLNSETLAELNVDANGSSDRW